MTSQVIRAVQQTRELFRVIALPRRTWDQDSAARIARELTELVRKPGGTMSLRPIQGQALLEAGTQGGLFGPIRVGGGKTLLSGLVPYIVDSKRPLLLLPAKLVDKTKREFRALASHWPIPNFIRFLSYELLGRVQSQSVLDQYQPDLIIADEAHKLKNRKASCTRRVHRYFATHPLTKCVAISGTFIKRSLKDYAHILAWCLKSTNLPLPQSYPELEDWADALDPKVAEDKRIGVGALALLQNEEERAMPDQVKATRVAFRRRLTETPGVVATVEGPMADCSLTIEALWGPREIVMGQATENAFATLRKEWSDPDGFPFSDPMSIWRVARELSLGFYNRWEPRGPDAWMSARREWAKACREILSTNRRNLDSELQVVHAVEEGHYPTVTPILQRWREIKGTFTPNSQPVWLDDAVIKAAADWLRESPGIAWCEHVPFAERLAKHTGFAYYGREGKDKRGRLIEYHPPDESLIASVASNAEGRNLQAWSRNLITSVFPNGILAEQILGRTHRDGQEADEVTFDLVVTSLSHIEAFEQALRDARYIEQTTSIAQKLVYADKVMPTLEEVANRPSWRWRK